MNREPLLVADDVAPRITARTRTHVSIVFFFFLVVVVVIVVVDVADNIAWRKADATPARVCTPLCLDPLIIDRLNPASASMGCRRASAQRLSKDELIERNRRSGSRASRMLRQGERIKVVLSRCALVRRARNREAIFARGSTAIVESIARCGSFDDESETFGAGIRAYVFFFISS